MDSNLPKRRTKIRLLIGKAYFRLQRRLYWIFVYDIDKKEIADEFIVKNHALMMYEPFLEDKQKEKS